MLNYRVFVAYELDSTLTLPEVRREIYRSLIHYYAPYYSRFCICHMATKTITYNFKSRSYVAAWRY
jgi:hypothetical protein